MEREFPGVILGKIRVPPPRSGLVTRTRLVDDISHTDAPLVLVRAPAGYGKSTLLAQWAYREDRRFAWVSLDPSEGDSTVFWRNVYAAIRVCIPGFASHLYDEMRTPEPNLTESIIPGLLNEFATLGDGTVIVLDDYHRVASSEVDRTVDLFVRHLPRDLTLVIASRSEPDIEVALLRSRGLVHDVGVDDLQLSVEDAGSLLRDRNPDLTDQDVRWIHSATEGWPVGVYLFGLLKHLDHSVKTTSNIRDYLMAQMLSDLSTEDLEFMRRASILSYLEGELCGYVTQTGSGQERLERLAGSNLLIMPTNQAGDRFRFHHLLEDELRYLLERDEAHDVVVALHRRAKEWTSDHGEISEAVFHAVRAGDMKDAGTLIAENWYEYVVTGRVRTAYQWLCNFSSQELQSFPPLAIAGALLAAFAGDVVLSRDLAAAAESATYEWGLGGATSYTSSVAIMRASIAADGPLSALADALRAAEIEPVESPYRPLLAAMIGSFQYSTVTRPETYGLLIEGSEAATGPPETAAYALGNLALLHVWQDDVESGESYAQKAITRIDETQVGGLMVFGLPYAVAARLAAERGDQDEAQRLLRSAERAEKSASNAAPFDSMVLRTTMAEACAALEEYGRARTYAERALSNLAVMTEGGLVARRLDHVIRLINNADDGAQTKADDSLLSPREVQVLSLMTTGETLEGIGRRLYVSRNTVKTHTAHIYRKLGVSNRDQAVAAARRLSLL